MKFWQFPSQNPLTASTLSKMLSAAKSFWNAHNETNNNNKLVGTKEYGNNSRHSDSMPIKCISLTFFNTTAIEELRFAILNVRATTARITFRIVCHPIGTANRRKFISITITIHVARQIVRIS